MKYDEHINAAFAATQLELLDMGIVVTRTEAANIFYQSAEIWSYDHYKYQRNYEQGFINYE